MPVDTLHIDPDDELDIGLGDSLLLEEPGPQFSSEPLPTHQFITDFREYRKGRCPEDWTRRWSTTSLARVEGSYCDLSHRNSFRLADGKGQYHLLTWNVAEIDLANRSDQSTRSLLHPLASFSGDSTIASPVLRAGDVSGTCYRLGQLLDGTSLSIQKIVAGAITTLNSAVVSPVKLGGYYWYLFEAVGTTIHVKYWKYGESEPSSWTVTATDSTLTDGYLGLLHYYPTAIVDVSIFSAATNGLVPLGESDLEDPMDVWISEPDEEVELIAKVEYYNPDTDEVENDWLGTHVRTTSASDYPPNTTIKPYLLDAGSITSKLEADAHLGGLVTRSNTPLRFRNLPTQVGGSGPLDNWTSYSFYGRPVEIRANRRWRIKPSVENHGLLMPMRNSEIIGCAIPNQEPDVGTDEAVLSIGPPTAILSDRLRGRRNIGISTGVKSLSASGWLSVPSHTSYALTDFNIYLRAFIPLAGIPGVSFSSLSLRQVDATHRQWHIALYGAGHATLAHRLHFLSYTSAGANLISSVTAPMNVGRFINIVFSVKGSDRWYVLIDDTRVAGGTIATDPDTCAGQIVQVIRDSSIGVIVCDHRIEQWVPEDEALARFSARRDSDSINLSMHRCDDNLGSIVTDYGPAANHGTLQGSDGIDRSWVPTSLGSAELAGVAMPISGGVIYHASTQPIDSVRELFRYNDRSKTVGSGLQARAKGLLITGSGVNYTDLTTDGGDGVIDIVGASDQPVTFGLIADPSTPEDSGIHVPQLASDELISRGSLTAETCDQDSFSGLRQLLPMKGGFHYTEPPQVATFLGDLLGSMGAYFGLDNSGRVAAGCLLPPVNPGPYGKGTFLEFLGYPNKGVTFSANSDYSLKQDADFLLVAWILPFRAAVQDGSIGSSYTYFPSGQTIIDHVDGASGWYLGIDGINQRFIFGSPGVTNTSAQIGAHFIYNTFPIQWGKWHLITARQCGPTHATQPDFRQLHVLVIDSGGTPILGRSFATFTTGTMAASDEALLKIGYGLGGSFTGSISYVFAVSPGADAGLASLAFLPNPPSIPISDGFFIPLTDARGDVALDQKSSREGRIEGARWCPRLTFDFRRAARPSLPNHRRSIPSWRTESRYKLNRFPLTGANVVAGVSAADRIALGEPYLSETETSENIRENYLDSRDIKLSTHLLSQSDSDFISKMIRERVSIDRRFDVVRDWWREMLKMSLTDEVLIYHDRNYPDGRPVRAAMITAKLTDMLGDIDTWG